MASEPAETGSNLDAPASNRPEPAETAPNRRALDCECRGGPHGGYTDPRCR
jgi:hypothetical protein